MAILAAIDETERSRRTVSVGYDLATAFDEPLVALHVIPMEDFEEHKETLQEMRAFSDFSFTQEEESGARFARRFVRESIDDPDMHRVEPRGRVGDVVETILEEAEAPDVRYLVVGGRRRSPVGKALFGNKTQEILLSAEVPVVTTMDRS